MAVGTAMDPLRSAFDGALWYIGSPTKRFRWCFVVHRIDGVFLIACALVQIPFLHPEFDMH
jgi:hypothetical protein